MNKTCWCAGLVLVFAGWQAPAQEKPMEIQITINGGSTISAVLQDSPAVQDFVALLPLSLELRDFAGTEKASGVLPQQLDIQDAPKGHTPSAGDVAYYAPWGNLALFHKNDHYAQGLVLLGKIEGDFTALGTPGNMTVTIKRMGAFLP